MKVIFIKDLKKVSKRGEIKELKDGYATFLIKNGIAKVLNDTNLKELEKENQEQKNLDNLNRNNANNLKINMEKLNIKYKVKTGKDGKVFGSVSQKQIKEELLKNGYKIDKKQILIDYPLSSLGYHKVKIELYKDIYAELNIQLIS